MSQVTITRIQESDLSDGLLADWQTLDNRIRERAYAIFQQRDSGDGGPLDHWLEAERDLTVKPELSLVENDSAFELNLAVPGFHASDLNLNALPGTLVVRGTAQSAGSNGFEEKMLFSRFELPAGVDVDRVTATLDNGVLRVTAPKAAGSETANGRRAAGSETTATAKAAAA